MRMYVLDNFLRFIIQNQIKVIPVKKDDSDWDKILDQGYSPEAQEDIICASCEEFMDFCINNEVKNIFVNEVEPDIDMMQAELEDAYNKELERLKKIRTDINEAEMSIFIKHKSNKFPPVSTNLRLNAYILNKCASFTIDENAFRQRALVNWMTQNMWSHLHLIRPDSLT